MGNNSSCLLKCTVPIKKSRIEVKDLSTVPKEEVSLKTLGHGGFCKVLLYTQQTRNGLIQKAIKTFNTEATPQNRYVDVLESLRRETMALKQLRHPHIVRILQDLQITEDKMFFVMEYCLNGSLDQYIAYKSKLTEGESKAKIRQLCLAVQYCHENLFCHRDIKSENILLDANYNIKLADFGLSQRLYSYNEKMMKKCGTLNFIAPEVLTLVEYGVEADIWSIGVVTYHCLSGKLPFFHTTDKKTSNCVISGKYKKLQISEDGGHFMKRLLDTQPKTRISLYAALNHKWLSFN